MIAAIATAALCLGCAPRLTQFYPDTFYPQDRIYENKPLGFAITFTGNWVVNTDPADMNKASRKVAQILHQTGSELLFSAFTVEGSQGARGIVDNLNLSNEEYLADIRKSNAASIQKDLGDTLFAAGRRLMIKWEYLYSGLHYAEFIFKSGTYNVRIAFWTKPELFERFLPVYEDIMNSATFANPQVY